MTTEERTLSELDRLPVGPPLPGLRFRRFAGAGDYPGMVEANVAARIAFGIEEGITAESLASQYDSMTNSDRDRDLVIVELDGRIVGYARVEWLDQTDGSRSYEMVCILDPALRGEGIGGAMLDWGERRIQQIAADHPAGRPRWYAAYNWDADAYAERLLERNGYRPVRRFFDMIRPNLEVLPKVELPQGFDLRPVGEAELRAVFNADAEAFQDHWGGVDAGEEAFRRFAGDPRLDPSLHVVAYAGDEIAGAVLNVIDDVENTAYQRRRGLLDSVFVRRPWRRRGLGRALIVRSLHLLRDRGMTSAWLGVDAENPNEALALYRSCGFEIGLSSTAWRKPLTDQWRPA
jgi:mycothiol synthase